MKFLIRADASLQIGSGHMMALLNARQNLARKWAFRAIYHTRTRWAFGGFCARTRL